MTTRGSRTYERFMSSTRWASMRQGYYERHGRWCRRCGGTTEIHLHHLSYDRFGGRETDADLMPLCQDCHSLVHRYHQLTRKLSLRQATLDLVEAQPPAAAPLKPPSSAAGRHDPVNDSLNALRDQRRTPLVPVTLVSEALVGVTRVVLKHHGYHRQVPRDVLGRWLEQPPRWLHDSIRWVQADALAELCQRCGVEAAHSILTKL